MSAEIVRFVFNHDDEETPIRATVREGGHGRLASAARAAL